MGQLTRVRPMQHIGLQHYTFRPILHKSCYNINISIMANFALVGKPIYTNFNDSCPLQKFRHLRTFFLTPGRPRPFIARYPCAIRSDADVCSARVLDITSMRDSSMLPVS